MADPQEWMEKLALQELFARYAHTVDGYDAEGWVDCFTEDGIFEVEGGGSRLQFRGREALLEFVQAHIQLLPGTRHVMTGHLAEIEGNEASHRCTLTGFLTRPGKVYTFASGWYESKLKKVNGQWKIAHRIAHCDNFEQFTQGEIANLFGSFNTWMAEHATRP